MRTGIPGRAPSLREIIVSKIGPRNDEVMARLEMEAMTLLSKGNTIDNLCVFAKDNRTWIGLQSDILTPPARPTPAPSPEKAPELASSVSAAPPAPVQPKENIDPQAFINFITQAADMELVILKGEAGKIGDMDAVAIIDAELTKRKLAKGVPREKKKPGRKPKQPVGAPVPEVQPV
jgi:hypothetical protein